MSRSGALGRIALGAVGVALLALAVGSSAVIAVRLYERPVRGDAPPPGTLEGPQPAEDVIVSEAAMWRNGGEQPEFAMDPRANRRPRAHPRTLATWRMRRAFPGAPPRIPHSLTSLEVLTASCNTCHARGGYSPRFGAHAPITPHADLQPCTQCHVSDAIVTGIGPPRVTAAPDAACRQCHFPANAPATSTTADVATIPWPRLTRRTAGGPPPVIPHDLRFRANCLSCHVGPGAVQEIRTTHLDRANCRQCHVTSEAVDVYARPQSPQPVATSAGGVP